VLAGVQGAGASTTASTAYVPSPRAPAAEVAARIGGWARVEPLTGTTCSFRMETDDLDGPVFALGFTGATFRVLGPPELVARVRTWAGRLAAAGETGG
jgi:hypothetical protein